MITSFLVGLIPLIASSMITYRQGILREVHELIWNYFQKTRMVKMFSCKSRQSIRVPYKKESPSIPVIKKYENTTQHVDLSIQVGLCNSPPPHWIAVIQSWWSMKLYKQDQMAQIGPRVDPRFRSGWNVLRENVVPKVKTKPSWCCDYYSISCWWNFICLISGGEEK